MRGSRAALRGALCALVLCAARSLVCAGLAKRARVLPVPSGGCR